MASLHRVTHVETVGRLLRLMACHFDLRPEDIDIDGPVEALDLESLEFLEFILAAEQTFGVDLDFYAAVTSPTLRRLAGLIELASYGRPARVF